MKDVPGFDQAAFEKSHEVGTPTTSIRLNRAKANAFDPVLDCAAIFPGSACMSMPWANDGFYLSSRPSFTADPLFHAGVYYVQEASSMFLEQVLKQSTDLSQPLKVLDLCAAPGGKSTLIQSLISPDSLLISNEVIKGRVGVLAENISKWGQPNVIVTNNDPRDFGRLESYFDIIVVDAPCSGSGLFRKDPAAINEWSLENVQLSANASSAYLATSFLH
jgi:16S rRNA C967 or C1407 C5-methylase (RsmB/RsmF family)